MTISKKVANYTDTQIEVMSTMYKGVDNKTEVAAIAVKLGKTPNSVRAKLGSLGKYVTVKTVAGSKKTGSKKSDICEEIGKLTNMNSVEVEALEKTTAAVLGKLVDSLTNNVKSEKPSK